MSHVLRAGGFCLRGPVRPALLPSQVAPSVVSVAGPAPSPQADMLTNFARGTNINNQQALYIPADGNYDINAGITYGAYCITRTANPLNAGPVWNRFTEDERDYIQLARWGPNYVTEGIDWHWWGGSNPNTAQAQAAFAVTDQKVAWARKYGLYTIFRLYVPPGGYQGYSGGLRVWGAATSWATPADSTSYMNQIRDWWLMFAAHYAGEPVVAAYDLLNEPSSNYINAQWYPYAAYLCDQINTVDAGAAKVVESGPSGQFFSNASLTGRTDIMYSIHMYGPGALTTPGNINGPLFTYPGPIPDYDSTATTGLTAQILSGTNAPFAISVVNTALVASGYPQSGSFTIALDNEIFTVSVTDATHVQCTARNVNGLGAATHNATIPAPIATYVLADPGAGGTSINVASTANFPTSGSGRYFTVLTEDVSYSGTDATHFNPASRAADGTTAAAMPVGSVVRNMRYFTLATLRYLFTASLGGRADFGLRFPMGDGESGCVNISPGYSQWVADILNLSNDPANWNSGWAHFDYRQNVGPGLNTFGLFNGACSGGFLTQSPVLAGEMTSALSVDNTLLNAISPYWHGNPQGRVY